MATPTSAVRIAIVGAARSGKTTLATRITDACRVSGRLCRGADYDGNELLFTVTDVPTYRWTFDEGLVARDADPLYQYHVIIIVYRRRYDVLDELVALRAYAMYARAGRRAYLCATMVDALLLNDGEPYAKPYVLPHFCAGATMPITNVIRRVASDALIVIAHTHRDDDTSTRGVCDDDERHWNWQMRYTSAGWRLITSARPLEDYTAFRRPASASRASIVAAALQALTRRVILATRRPTPAIQKSAATSVHHKVSVKGGGIVKAAKPYDPPGRGRKDPGGVRVPALATRSRPQGPQRQSRSALLSLRPDRPRLRR
jgi:hypothetical protein